MYQRLIMYVAQNFGNNFFFISSHLIKLNLIIYFFPFYHYLK